MFLHFRRDGAVVYVTEDDAECEKENKKGAFFLFFFTVK